LLAIAATLFQSATGGHMGSINNPCGAITLIDTFVITALLSLITLID